MSLLFEVVFDFSRHENNNLNVKKELAPPSVRLRTSQNKGFINNLF